MEEKEMHIISFNRDKDVTPESIIPIEKIKAPILILSSKNDSVWPSYESGIYIEKKLEESGFPYEHKHIAYEHMSHALLTKLPIIYKMAFKTERENSKACATDRENLKKELLDWINNVWNRDEKYAIIDGTGPLSNDGSWGNHMQFTACAAKELGMINGPRCCKRDAMISFKNAIEYVNTHYDVYLEYEKIRCEYSGQNAQCIKERCPYYE